MPPTKAELAFIRDATGALDEDINAAFAAKNNDVNETVEFLISSTLSFFSPPLFASVEQHTTATTSQTRAPRRAPASLPAAPTRQTWHYAQ